MVIDHLHTIDQEKVGANYVNLASGSTTSYESIVRTSGGREIPVQVYARQVQIEGISHIQWILRDITERKNLDSLRDDLISMIYHDLRSPLANVVSSLDVLATALPQEGDPAFKSLLNIAIRSTERIQRLTNSLLDINRLEAGQPVGKRQPATPLSLIGDAVDAITPTSQSKNLEVIASIAPDLPPVMVDVDMVRRVLINLLENATKYTPTGGKIQVGARQENGAILFWVNDNGPGIPPGERDRIFDKFTRLHAKDGPRGLGLGLAYCRLAVVGHGGKIWVDPEPGIGSSFKFTLPISGDTHSQQEL
jgi:signal transduction histidine kinase